MQCVAVCCSVLQCVAVCSSVLQCVAVYCSVLHCVAVRCIVLQCVAVCCISSGVSLESHAHLLACSLSLVLSCSLACLLPRVCALSLGVHVIRLLEMQARNAQKSVASHTIPVGKY